MENRLMKKRVFYFFALSDAIVLAVYLYYQLSAMRIPFFSDMINVYNNATLWFDREGGISFIVVIVILGVLNILFYFSLFVSIWLYLKSSNAIKSIVMLQFPLRLFLFSSTIPFFGTFMNRLLPIEAQIHYIVAVYVLLGVIEIAKLFYLFRLKS